MFYGWWVVAGVFLAQMTMTGFYTYCFPLFVIPLETEFGASRTEVMTAMSAMGLIGIVLPLLLGPLVDKWSVRGLMGIGALILGIAFMALSYSPSIGMFTLMFAPLIALSAAMLGPMTGSTVVSRWFSQSRGLALGIAAIGTSVGGFVMPLLVAESIEQNGWRTTLQYLSYFVLAIVTPYVIAVIRDYPSDKGETPDGKPLTAAQTAAAENFVPTTWQEIVRQRTFWLLSISLGVLFGSYSSLMANLTAYAGGLGVESGAAAQLISVIAVLGFIGKLVFGSLADRMSLKFLLGTSMTLTATAMLILSTEPAYSGMVAAAVLMGLSAGGMLPVWGALIPRLFGLSNYGRVMGFMMPVIALISMPGFIVLAKIYDVTGSYKNGLMLFAGLVVFGILLLLPLKVPEHEA